MIEQLHLWFLGNPLTPRYVGVLRTALSGRHLSFTYDQTWINEGFPLSEDMPLDASAFTPLASDRPHPLAPGAIDDARPDRWGEKVIRQVEKPDRLSLLEYLYYAGDARFGAMGVSLRSQRYEPLHARALPDVGQADTLAEAAEKIEASETLSENERKFISGSGSPLGGAKPKAVITLEGAEWILKFFNGEPIDAPLVEHATMTLARQAGITVANTRIVKVRGVNALVVERFDRAKGLRLHCFSAATAIRAAGWQEGGADMGYPDLAAILRRSGRTNGQGAQEARELFRRMVFNILMDNTDDHGKNHALIVEDVSSPNLVSLAPAYDVLPSASGQGRQEFRCGRSGGESTLSNALSEREAFGLTSSEARAEIARVISVVDLWKAHFKSEGVLNRDIDALALSIDAPALRLQREDFNESAVFSEEKAKSPFQRLKRARRRL